MRTSECAASGLSGNVRAAGLDVRHLIRLRGAGQVAAAVCLPVSVLQVDLVATLELLILT